MRWGADWLAERRSARVNPIAIDDPTIHARNRFDAKYDVIVRQVSNALAKQRGDFGRRLDEIFRVRLHDCASPDVYGFRSGM